MTDTIQLLERFGLITEDDLASLLGIGVRSLRNRPRTEMPTYVKAGRRRLYVEKSVREYLERKSSQRA